MEQAQRSAEASSHVSAGGPAPGRAPAAAAPGRCHVTTSLDAAAPPPLALGTPGDDAEQHAEQVSAAVATALGGGPKRDAAQARELAARTAKRSVATAAPVRALEPAQAAAIDAARRAGGAALPGSIAAELSEVLQQDLSRVRLHRGDAADALNRELGSVAFTVGNDIFLSRAADDGGERGRALLAHEIAHVLQGAGDGNLVQRALGIEIECSKLPITKFPSGAKKGDVLKQTGAWQMMFEETTTGQPVVEFKTEPAPSTRAQFVGAVREMASEAAGIGGPWGWWGSWYGAYTVQSPDKSDVGGSIQVTAGVPLDKIVDVYKGFDEDDAVKQVGDVVNEPPVDKELGVDFSELSPRARGFMFLVCDYVRRGHVPIEGFSKHEVMKQRTEGLERWTKLSEDTENPEVHEQVKRYQGLVDHAEDDIRLGYRGDKRYPKATFGVLARNNFSAIFRTLPVLDQIALTDVIYTDEDGEPLWGQGSALVLKQKYVDWLTLQGTQGSDKRSLEDKQDESLVNYAFTDGNRVPTKRGKWLRNLPDHDELAEVPVAEVGTYKDSRMDRAKSGKAPLLEFRNTLGNMPAKPDPGTWGDRAKVLWKAYHKAVGGERVYRGNEKDDD